MTGIRSIYLVRHCQSEANVGGILEGAGGDSPLTQLGRLQTTKVVDLLSDLGVTSAVVVASPQKRAWQTAKVIAGALGDAVIVEPRLREGEVGWMEGLTFAQVDDHKTTRGVKFINAEVHGGETFESVGERTHAALTSHLGNTVGSVIFVTHGFALRTLLWKIYGEGGTKIEKAIGNGDVLALQVAGLNPVGALSHHALIA